MKPIYESISPSTISSFKVESYDIKSNCESAGWHIHPEYEIVYIKNGTGTLKIADKIRRYTNGTLLFLGGNIPHSDFGNKDRTDNLEVVVQFTKEFIDKKLTLFREFAKINALLENANNVLIFDSDTKYTLGREFEKFDALDNQSRLINLLSILDYMSNKNTFEKLFNTRMTHSYRTKEIYRLEQVFEYLNKNYNRKVRIMEIASKVGLTPNSFSRFFKKMTKRKFIDFLNEFRISKAIEKMNRKNPNIAEILYESGFNDPSYFTRQFRKYQGVSPSEYLKSKYY